MITDHGGSIAVDTSVYRWEWSRESDLVRLTDARYVPVQSANGYVTIEIAETLGATPVESITLTFS